MEKESYVLDPQWQFKEFPPSARRMRDLDSGDWLAATVPSSIFSCLTQNGRLSKEELVKSPEKVSWVSEKSWVFRKEFDVPDTLLAKERIEIIFDGLDTVTHVWLNEKLLGKTENGGIYLTPVSTSSGIERYGQLLPTNMVYLKAIFYSKTHVIPDRQTCVGCLIRTSTTHSIYWN